MYVHVYEQEEYTETVAEYNGTAVRIIHGVHEYTYKYDT